MKLSIIIPCYNEEQTIKNLLKELFNVNFSINTEVIVIDDGSDRDLEEILEEEIKKNKIKFIKIPQNQGKGVAIRLGLKYASGDIFIIQDADFEYSPIDIPRLLEPILNKETDVVYGTRFLSIPHQMSKSHFLGNRILTKLTNFLYKTNITDMETGYKIFSKKILDNIVLESRQFEFEPEITAKISINRYRIKEIPIRYNFRKYGVAKIKWIDGIDSLFILFKIRFFDNNKIFNYFYKLFKFHFKPMFDKLSKFIKIKTIKSK